MSLRPFLDANILFTAAYNPQGLARLLFDLHEQKSVFLLTSDLAVEEARVNLEIKRPSALAELMKLVENIKLINVPARLAVILDLPAKDLLIFAAAVAGKSSHLLTGDKKHFSRYFNKPESTAGIVIQTVREFFTENFDV
jgi:predicted nucleic acid-binding protein